MNQKMWFRENTPTGRSDLYLIDSVSTSNITTFYYPRTSCKIMGAGECSPISYEEAGMQNNWYYSNPGAFNALSKRNDTVFFHQPNGVNFYFLPLAEPGQSWTIDYNSTHFTCTQITITCESITQGDVLGIPDLIKTFTLQANGTLPGDVNLDTLNFKLSQHYGFIEYIPYQTLINSNTAPLSESLIGLENESIQTGYTMPSFTDFFHLSPGDIRMFEVINEIVFPQSYYTEYYRDSIKSAFISADSIAYTFRREIKKQGSPTITIYENDQEYYTTKEWGFMIAAPPAGFEAMTDITGLDAFKDIVEKQNCCISQDKTTTSFSVEFLYDVIILESCEFSWMCDGSWGKSIDTELGLIGWWRTCEYAHLIGYQIGANQWGNIWLNTTENPQQVESLLIRPNPAKNELTISLPDNQTITKQITITSFDGKCVLNQQFYENSLNVSMLSSGCYLMTIKTDNRVYQGKFIKE